MKASGPPRSRRERIRGAVDDFLGRAGGRIALALLLAPLFVAAVTVLADRDLALTRDHALTELRVRDVGREPVLIGLYSREDWSHPGPALFYTLALPYRLTGGDPSGLLLGALAINGAAIWAMVILARRLGGEPAMFAVLLVLSLMTRALGPQVLYDPWVCFVSVLPFGLLCFLAWAMISGEAWALPVAAGLASWLVQTHVGYAPLSAPLLGAGTLSLYLMARGAGDPARLRSVTRAVLLTIPVVLVLWALPLYDQVNGYGNLGAIVDWFSDPALGTHTLQEGFRVVFGQFAAVPDWLTGERRIGLITGETELRLTTLWPVLLVPFVSAAILASRRDNWSLVRFAGVVTLTLLTSVVAVARTVGIMYEYRLLWTWLLGAFGAAVVLWSGWSFVESRWPRARPLLLSTATATLGIVSIIQITAAFRADDPNWVSPETEAVADDLASRFDREGGELLLHSETTTGELYLHGLLLRLERLGFEARVASDSTRRFGDHRIADPEAVQARLLVLADDDLDDFMDRRGLSLVAYRGPMPLAERVREGERSVAAFEELLAALDSGAMSREEFRQAVEALPYPGPTLAVFREDDPDRVN